MLPLAEPSFTGLPDAVVKQIDVYTEVGTELKNSLASKLSAFEVDLNSIVSGATKMVKNIGDKLRNNGIDLAEAKDRIQQALGGSRSAITSIAESLERGITSELTGFDESTGYIRKASEMYDSVTLVMDGVKRTFQNADYKSVSGIVGFIGDLTNNQLISTLDLGAQAALVKGILTEVTEWGIPEIIDETFGAKWNESSKSYDYDYDDYFRFSVTKRASSSINGSTSLTVIEQLMTHGGDKALVADNPQFPMQLLAGYTIPNGCVPGGPYPVDPTKPDGAQTVDNYYSQGRRLLKILNSLKPDWFYVTRNVLNGKNWVSETVWNLECLSVASDAAKSVLATMPDFRTAIMAAPFYRVESGKAMLKTMYPYWMPSAV